MKSPDRIILGIDPGTNVMGYGIIGIENRNARLIGMGVIRLGKSGNAYMKLKHIYSETLNLIDRFHPDELSIEAPFFGKNVQSMLKLGRAQGVAIAAALAREVPIFEYAPRKIKMAITGQGAASKEQVAAILGKILNIKDLPKDLDATDGVAVALCHFYQDKAISVETGYKGWEDFIQKNPGKVK